MHIGTTLGAPFVYIKNIFRSQSFFPLLKLYNSENHVIIDILDICSLKFLQTTINLLLIYDLCIVHS